jgi:serine/threonine protein phosphatase PrpC
MNQMATKSTYSSLADLNLFAEGHCIKKDGSTAKYGKCGEDSYTIALKKGGSSLIAVADGVGGWVTHGGDSSGVSNGMMKMMKKLHQENAKIDNLNGLIKLAFNSLKETRKFSKGNQ